MTGPNDTFQLSMDAAEAYEATFVPALFGEWAPLLVDAAGVGRGDAVLDVACGTGVVARTAADRAGPAGRVVGVDVNDAMLAVARRVRPDIDWRKGDASDLPLPDASFDVVLCQAALMFFPAPARALEEMARVVRHDGTIGLQVWGSLDEQPAYRLLTDVAADVAGPEAVDVLGAYWTLGDAEKRRALLEAAGLDLSSSARRTGTVRLPSLDDFVRVEVEATPLADRLDEAAYARLRERARQVLRPFAAADGRAEIPIVGHVLTARPTGGAGGR